MVDPLGRRSGRESSQVRKISHLVSYHLRKLKIGGRFNVSKHREIKGSDKYVTLDITLKFDSMDKTGIKSSESKVKLLISVKGLITSMGLKDKVRQKK